MTKKIIIPTYIYLSNNKKYHLNLNNYRNWHFYLSNRIKKEFKEIVQYDLLGLRFKKKISLDFILIKKSKRKIDRSNVLSIIEKFFCDTMVECGCIPDDNDDYIESTHYYSKKGDDKKVIILIKEIK